jgi:hypothetical protein
MTLGVLYSVRDKCAYFAQQAEGEEMALVDDAADRALSRVQPAGLSAFDEALLRRPRGLTRQGAFRKGCPGAIQRPSSAQG